MSNQRKPELRLFVGNLDFHTTVNDVREMLKRFGKVNDVYFPNHAGKPTPKLFKRRRKPDEPINYGCAFVQMKNQEEVQRVLSHEGEVFDPNGRLVFFAKATSA